MRSRPIVVYRASDPSALVSVIEYGTHRISTRLVDRKLDSFAAVLIERGTGSLRTTAGGLQTVAGPAIFWLWPGELHSYGPDAGSSWDEQWALFEGRITGDLLTGALIEPSQPLLVLHDLAELQRQFAALHAEMLDETPLGRAMAGATLHRIALMSARQNQTGRGGRSDRPITPALAALRLRAFENIDLEGLAREFDMSPATLRRKVIAATGVPPKAYQLRLRLDRAKQMLALTDGAIETIARETGFDDAFYFSRVFAHREGCSPTAFRQRNRRG